MTSLVSDENPHIHIFPRKDQKEKKKIKRFKKFVKRTGIRKLEQMILYVIWKSEMV